MFPVGSVWAVLAPFVFNNVLGFELQIFHTNDMNARFEETSRTGGSCDKKLTCYGGFARVAQYVKTNRRTNSLYLDAGNIFQGSSLFNAFGQEIAGEMVSLLGLDAMTLGNHEFDRAPKGLKEYISKLRTPVVACNVDGSSEPDFARANLKKYTVFTFQGVKVGVVGYVTPDVKTLSLTGKVKVTDYMDCLKKSVKDMKTSGVNLVIALGHAGYEKDLEIAREVEDVDVVVGGHSKTFLYTGATPELESAKGKYPTEVKQRSGKRVPVVQAFENTKYVGVLYLRYNSSFQLIEAHGNPVLMRPGMPQDPRVTQALAPYKTKLKQLYEKKVGSTKVDLDGSCENKECNLGNFVADAMSVYVETNSKSKNSNYLTIGLVNAGAIKGSFLVSTHKNGDILKKDVAAMYPYLSQLKQVRVTGTQLINLLSHSLSRLGKGGFLQVSNLKVIYPKGSGKKIVAVVQKRDNKLEEVKPDKQYDLAVLEFLYVGGDGYNFNNVQLVETYPREIINIFEEAVTKKSPLNVQVTGRIAFNDNPRFVS